MELSGVALRLQAMGQDLLLLAGSVENDAAVPLALAEIALRLFRDRRARATCFSEEIFGEPAWDILLDLYIAWTRGRRVSSSEPSLAAAIPQTTSLRWLAILEDEGLIERVPDPRDKRRIFVGLSGKGREAMEQYLGALRSRW